MGHYTRHWGVLVLRGALDHAEEEEYTENHTARWRGAQYEIGRMGGLGPELRKGQKVYPTPEPSQSLPPPQEPSGRSPVGLDGDRRGRGLP